MKLNRKHEVPSVPVLRVRVNIVSYDPIYTVVDSCEWDLREIPSVGDTIWVTSTDWGSLIVRQIQWHYNATYPTCYINCQVMVDDDLWYVQQRKLSQGRL